MPMRRLLLAIPFIIATPCHAQTQGAPVEAFSFGARVGTQSNPLVAALSSVVPSAHASTQAAAPVELVSYGRRIGTPDNPISINIGNALAPYLTQTQAAATYLPLTGGSITGRVGISIAQPQSALDVVGNAIFGSDTNGHATFGNLGIINSVCQPGVGNRNQVDRNTFMDGVNTLQALCLNNPGRYRWTDLNLTNAGRDGTLSEQYLDGSQATRIVAHPVNAASAARQILLTDCGTTISVTGSSAVAMTIGTGLAAGCRITVTQLGTGSVSIAPLSGETIGWYDTQAETGTYSLPGQYSSAVIEAKTTSLATVERGQ